MDFMPPGYVEPVSGSDKYLKLKQGENTFRILGSAIAGNVGWTVREGKKKPIRHTTDVPFSPNEVDYDTLKHFIAVPVWNYALSKVQVAEFTQASIRKAIIGYSKKPNWGSPTEYDICITREGEGMETEYQVAPEPKSPIPADAQEAWEKIKPTFDLNRLFEGGDPFAPSSTKVEGEVDISKIPF